MLKDGGDYGMFYFLSGTVLNCIEIVIEKYLMEHKYITIYNLLFYEGCIEFSLNIIVFLFFNALFKKEVTITILDIELMNFDELATAFKTVSRCILYLFGHFVVDFIIELS